MKTTIQHQLKSIEQEHELKILFSCESGSRGWQFPSEDSDFDVRFIYVRPLRSYLSVTPMTDHVNLPINNELDVYGWDLRKVLQLIRKSNTTPFEWLQSPVVYRATADFRDQLWNLCTESFNQRNNIFHYLGIAKSALDTMVSADHIRIKKLFYVLRPLLAAKWCLEKQEIAPMTIWPLLNLMPSELRNMVNELIAFKASTSEALMIRIDPALKMYINQQFNDCMNAAKNLPKDNFTPVATDAFFFKMLTENDDT